MGKSNRRVEGELGWMGWVGGLVGLGWVALWGWVGWVCEGSLLLGALILRSVIVWLLGCWAGRRAPRPLSHRWCAHYNTIIV